MASGLPLTLVVVWSVGYLSVINVQALVGESCVEGDVRLVGGSHYREGTVEVCRHRQWGRVCDDMWDEQDSGVVCRQLGLASEGVVAVAGGENDFNDNNMLPFVLDDLGCNGSERNLLECLPAHNCDLSGSENAGVRCLRKGTTLEHGSERLMNNSLITLNNLGEGNRALFCATDNRLCCTAESDQDGNWYTPTGSEIDPQIDNSTQALYVNRSNQTTSLNYVNITDYDIPSGIYQCEIADNNNITNHLYVGIYPQHQGIMRIISLNYDSVTNTLVCTSAGGPVTAVMWSKGNKSMINNDQYYEQSVVIVNRTSATYESRLRILNKSSESTGNYTCMVSNSGGSSNRSIHLEVCRDLELRFGDQDSGNVEVCSGDQWHAVSNGVIVNNNTRGNISVIAVNPTSVTIGYTSNSISVQAYDMSCTTVSNGQIHSIKVTGMSIEVTVSQINGLTPNTDYECCATAYTITTVPINTISLSCTTARTPSLPEQPPEPPPETEQLNNNLFMIGFWTILGICLLLLCLCAGFIVAYPMALKHTRSLKHSTRPIEKEYAERMVLNPIYNGSGSSDDFRDRNLSVAQNPQYGTRAEILPVHVTYETISDFPARRRADRRNISQPGVDTNGLGNSLVNLQQESVDSKPDVGTSQLYSTIPESYKHQQKLGSNMETQKQTPVVDEPNIKDSTLVL